MHTDLIGNLQAVLEHELVLDEPTRGYLKDALTELVQLQAEREEERANPLVRLGDPLINKIERVDLQPGTVLIFKLGASAPQLGTDTPWIPSLKDCEAYESVLLDKLPQLVGKVFVTHFGVEVIAGNVVEVEVVMSTCEWCGGRVEVEGGVLVEHYIELTNETLCRGSGKAPN